MKSAESDIIIQVPQGSILGPIHSLFYLSDLPSVVSNAKYTLFADDTTISLRSPVFGKDERRSVGCRQGVGLVCIEHVTFKLR